MAASTLSVGNLAAGLQKSAFLGTSEQLKAKVCSPSVRCPGKLHAVATSEEPATTTGIKRRDAIACMGLLALLAPSSARADLIEVYTAETEAVIAKVRSTLQLDKNDPAKAAAVADLRATANDWVAKYRREKSVAGKPSFSNMYSVLNAIAGHYVSFGANYPIPAKRQDRILEEVTDAEKALGRGR